MNLASVATVPDIPPIQTKLPNRVIWGIIVAITAACLTLVLVFAVFRKPSQYPSVALFNAFGAQKPSVLNQFKPPSRPRSM
jgi:hypothetical protein